jgi:hypothetical protein
MGANSLTERGGVLLVNDAGGFQAYQTIPGTNEWKDISWHPENYPALRVTDLTATKEELTAHIQQHFIGWTARKMNLTKVALDDNAEVIQPVTT